MLLKNESYDRSELVSALKKAGLSENDVIFLQVSHDSLGKLQDDCSSEKEPELLYSAVREIVGPEGTVVVPSFSFSFERDEDFDVEHTPSVHGKWSTSLDFVEYFRRLPGVVRS